MTNGLIWAMNKKGRGNSLMKRKGIILAGGLERLFPLTISVLSNCCRRRQADDLLPTDRAHVGGYPRHSYYHYVRRSGVISTAA